MRRKWRTKFAIWRNKRRKAATRQAATIQAAKRQAAIRQATARGKLERRHA